MGVQTVDIMVDDLTGEPIYEGEGRTVELSFDGATCELDLTEKNIQDLGGILRPWFLAAGQGGNRTRAAKRATQASQARTAPSQASGVDREAMKEIREWARANGYAVGDRGRIPFAVMDAFTKAHMKRGRRKVAAV